MDHTTCKSCMAAEATRHKIDELHDAIVGTIEKPGLQEKHRALETLSKRHTGYFATLTALIGGWAVRAFLNTGG